MCVHLSSDPEQSQAGYLKPSVLCINLFVFKLEWDRRVKLSHPATSQLRSSNENHHFLEIMVPAVFQFRDVCAVHIAGNKTS